MMRYHAQFDVGSTAVFVRIPGHHPTAQSENYGTGGAARTAPRGLRARRFLGVLTHEPKKVREPREYHTRDAYYLE